MGDIKLCVNCIHHSPSRHLGDGMGKCNSKNVAGVNLVTGDPKQVHCTFARSSPQGCGESGRWYSSKTPEEAEHRSALEKESVRRISKMMRAKYEEKKKKKCWWKFWEWFL